MAGQYQLGRLGRTLVAEEATYGVTPALLATMAMRHLDVGLTWNPKARVNSEEKRGTVGIASRFDRRESAGFDVREAYLRPSGTIGTIPESHLLLKHGFGTAVVGTLNTTATGVGGTTSTFPLTSVVGLTAGEWVSVRRAANGNKVEARRVTAIAGSDVTVSPALGGVPAAGDTVKAGVTYKLANLPTNALSILHYLTDLKRAVRGNVVDQLSLQFNNNEEVKFSASGPGKDQMPRADVPAIPGFTTVGSQNPPSGLAGGAIINGVAYPILSLDLQLANNFVLQNEDYGTSNAVGFYRDGFREVTFSLEARVNDNFTVLALAELVSSFELFLQTGVTEGNVVAIAAPEAEFEQVPDIDDPNGALTYSFAGVMTEASTNGNDEASLGLL